MGRIQTILVPAIKTLSDSILSVNEQGMKLKGNNDFTTQINNGI
jgi:hypothetical protein